MIVIDTENVSGIRRDDCDKMIDVLSDRYAWEVEFARSYNVWRVLNMNDVLGYKVVRRKSRRENTSPLIYRLLHSKKILTDLRRMFSSEAHKPRVEHIEGGKQKEANSFQQWTDRKRCIIVSYFVDVLCCCKIILFGTAFLQGSFSLIPLISIPQAAISKLLARFDGGLLHGRIRHCSSRAIMRPNSRMNCDARFQRPSAVNPFECLPCRPYSISMFIFGSCEVSVPVVCSEPSAFASPKRRCSVETKWCQERGLSL